MFDNRDNMDKLLKVAHKSKSYDDFIREVSRSTSWYLDDRTKPWKKEDFKRFYNKVKEAIGG
jgi:hypothetical protein